MHFVQFMPIVSMHFRNKKAFTARLFIFNIFNYRQTTDEEKLLKKGQNNEILGDMLYGISQCRSKGNISGGARERWRREPQGGCGGMLPQKILKSRGLEMLFPAFSKSYL